ncbi:Zn finger-containing GTPase- Activating Protein for ARF [Xylographa parallela]|nr:Zn finger-containing GTPase- Activating Protein for ARF [Xylographa parallela]
MWEVDPETKSKLLALQKFSGNTSCIDCGAPSPQWASPKFGTFICLSCAGIHRGLGVHISFVRSISMDSFKVGEVRRMEEGGNTRWKEFWEGHADGGAGKKGAWETVGVERRYTGDVGEEYKERLSAKVEGREYVPLPKKEKKVMQARERSATLLGGASPARSGSPAVSGLGGRKEKNEAYFAKLGNDNATRPADLPPNQGGKFTGFGSAMPEPSSSSQRGGTTSIPGVDEFQKDPVAALTKGFGWFTATVGKGAKTLNEGYIQPTAQKAGTRLLLAEADLATQARLTATAVAQNVQKGTKGAAEQFNKFVEGAGDSGASERGIVEPEKKDFWDSFGSPTNERNMGAGSGAAKKSSAIGTAAMKSSGGKDEWGDDGWDKF